MPYAIGSWPTASAIRTRSGQPRHNVPVSGLSFFTAGPDETRAWTIPDGSSAVDAAGAIHTDLARGFIRAEVVAYEDLIELGSMAEARRHGKLRSEGKTYRMKDGDVTEVLFNV